MVSAQFHLLLVLPSSDDPCVLYGGSGVGGYGAYMCKKSRSYHQGTKKKSSKSRFLWRKNGVSANLYLFPIASLAGNGVFDGSYLLAGISLVYGFYLIGRSKHLVFDYAEGGL